MVVKPCQPSLEDVTIDGVNVFWSLPDAADQCIDEAFALAKVMGSAFSTGREVHTCGLSGNIDTLNDLNDDIKAHAMDGIARLLAMAKFCREASTIEMRSV